MTKIMLVEDDNNLREIYETRLLAEGFEIISAKDGEEALAMAVKERPDLIISDIMMPKISGFDMLDILRTTPETKDTKIIMMTALSQIEDKNRAEKLGADRYLVKSQVTLEDVARVTHEVLESDSRGSAAAPDQPSMTNMAAATSVAAGQTMNPTNNTPVAAPMAVAEEPAASTTPDAATPTAAPDATNITSPDSGTESVNQPPVSPAPADDILKPIVDPGMTQTTAAEVETIDQQINAFVSQTYPDNPVAAQPNVPTTMEVPDTDSVILPAGTAMNVTAEASAPAAPSIEDGEMMSDQVNIANKKIIAPINDLSQPAMPQLQDDDTTGMPINPPASTVITPDNASVNPTMSETTPDNQMSNDVIMPDGGDNGDGMPNKPAQ